MTLLRRSTAMGRWCAIIAILVVSGCGPDVDPLTRSGLWVPNHSNNANLSLMVASPADLTRGTGTTSANGQLAAAAVDRLRNDKVKKLPAADISTVSTGSSGDNNGSASGAP